VSSKKPTCAPPRRRRLADRVQKPGDRVKRAGHRAVAAAVFSIRRQRALDCCRALTSLRALSRIDVAGDVAAVHDTGPWPDRRPRLEVLAEQLRCRMRMRLLADATLITYGAWDIDVHVGGRVGVRERGVVAPGITAPSTLRVAEEELGRPCTARDRVFRAGCPSESGRRYASMRQA